MKLIVLGSYGPFPPAGGTCSGYLLEHEGFYVLLDCGNGVLSRMQEFITVSKLGAVIVSHLHSDHISDLFILRYALQMEMEQGSRNTPLLVIAPEEPHEEFLRLSYKNVYRIEPIIEDKIIDVGPFRFSFKRTIHAVPCFAIAVYLGEFKKLVYSADTEFFPEFVPFACNAPLLLCESNFLTEDLLKGSKNHLSAFQAASLAREAGVQRLLLTHLPPFRNKINYLEEASSIFGAVTVAEEGKVYDIERLG
ncbi:MAG: MBL fold metallo-hydrolase [Dethiobacter sp.]|jgi:ribonuclease BN (tRNA processing enzyme)|nr:MAG: MBL fold metallo-hydrolase [Dethiobacter sp.]